MSLFNCYQSQKHLRYVDLFCGIGGFRIAADQVFQQYDVISDCVFSSEIDTHARKMYEANFGEKPGGDITKVATNQIPDHDLLLAGFPCQPFSICGDLKGFEDTRGTLFFDIARILEAKKPYAFVLENVKQLVGHKQGKTLQTILKILADLGYYFTYKVLNALEFGLPQKRERVFIVGCLEPINFKWESKQIPFQSLSSILESNVPFSYYASEKIQNSRLEKYTGKQYEQPTIWHENKSGHISAYPYSCAMRAGASYNYLLVDGKRRLTEREMLRLQGFPEDFKIVCSYTAIRKLVGNSVAIPCVFYVLNSLVKAVEEYENKRQETPSKL
ncbi:MAG: DNA cytosine methyltransferase [Microcystaceae cyanobacterium]